MILEKIKKKKYDIQDIVTLLKAEGEYLKLIYNEADKLRQSIFGDDIYLRGIIEFSNYCTINCDYCGIRCENTKVSRYRISDDEILKTCKLMQGYGQTTVVLQSGEDPFYTKEKLGALIERIKKETSLAVTLSTGERSREEYRYLKERGMDRYLLRFETSNIDLFARFHPDSDYEKRIESLNNLKQLNIQTGSGFLIGLPGETYEELAGDMLFCTELDLDMIGAGPFISNPETPLNGQENPFDKEVYFKVIAILRLLNPRAHIPSTTAFDAVDPMGRNKLLQRGANVFMPNATPQKYRADYMLYPGKPCVDESGDDCARCIVARLKMLGRNIGQGPGHSIR
ncbi:MAG: [FeFe] hydrogenase H-cluster radical SAM maturase HydE [bacterium]|nr:[FeFe] hydrogenase H-cluster radical SAM maturase HydE [bacterium]